MAKNIAKQLDKPSIYLDLEYFVDQNKLKNAPDLFFQEHENKVIILDEVQRMPELFPLFRSMIDQNRKNGRFILLGSASPDLLRKSSETLAGRIVYLDMEPLHFREVQQNISYQNHWLRGGFPDALLAPNDKAHNFWFRGFMQTYIERDLPNLGLSASPDLLRNLLRMLASIQGGLLNYAELSNSLGVSQPSIKTYIDFLEAAFLVRRLKPYFTNVGKRLVKSPKIYLKDTGMLHYLMGIQEFSDLQGHICLGNSWESYVIQQIIACIKPDVEPYFYRTKDKAELDLVLVQHNEVKISIEIKYSNSPQISKGNTIAYEDLGAKLNLVVCPQSQDYWLKEKVRVCNINSLWNYLHEMGVV